MCKKTFYVLIQILLGFLFFSCEKNSDNSLPECDVNGVWIGEWDSNLQTTGTFCASVTQNSTDFTGKICIRIEEPGKDNYNRDFEGTVKSKNVRTVMSVSGVKIAAEGDVTDDTIVSGNFSVPDLSMHGTFSGKKIPTSEAILTEIYSSPHGEEEHISDFIYIDNSLWIFMYPEVWIDDSPKTKVFKYNTEGNLVETFYYQPVLYYDIASDGQYIWNLDNGVLLFKFDTNGNKVDSLELSGSMDSHKLACSSSHLFLFTESTIYKTDQSLNVIEIINPGYNFPSAYASYSGFQLYSSGNILYKLNEFGDYMHAYVLPDDYIISDIETNGDKVWCFVKWFDENSGNDMYPIYYTVYEIKLNF